MPVPSQESPCLLSDSSNYYQLAHLLREVRRAVQLVHQGGARLLDQIHKLTLQVLLFHASPDRGIRAYLGTRWVP